MIKALNQYYFVFIRVRNVFFKMFLWNLTQNKRMSGFGASDELSSEEEEGVQPVELTRPLLHQERSPAATWTSAPASSVRKRNLKSNPKPTVRTQVNLIVSLDVIKTGVVCKR